MSGNPVCTQCGFTLAEFRARGLLGCPACYDQLDDQTGEALRAELLQLHPLLYRRPAAPGAAPASSGGEDAAALRERLGDALRGERYEEAAALRKRIDALKPPRDTEGRRP
jgi:protein arginine kinase activator